jgi:ubiquinone/menaquinone biosynthesis C-methylase UbiE
MSFYREKVLPRVQDKVMNSKGIQEARARVCAPLSGTVVEVGFGTGRNARYYPSDVTTIYAVEPSQVCMQIAQPRIARSQVPVENAGLTGERLDLPSEGFDGVLSTWTLCTIPDWETALQEIRRVLKPGGRFHFVEHGHSPDPKIASWQRRIEPFWKRPAGGCHITRRIDRTIEEAGFRIETLDTYYIKGEPKPIGYTYEGRAVKV